MLLVIHIAAAKVLVSLSCANMPFNILGWLGVTDYPKAIFAFDPVIVGFLRKITQIQKYF